MAVHPLVLLSVVDHYNRACKGTTERAVGLLLGSWQGGRLDVANSFAVPFEEDEKNPEVWFLDHDYLSTMFGMFRKVNAKERVIGWYHTGPKLRGSDIQINEVISRFVANPILVIIDAYKTSGLPTAAYVSVEDVHDDGTPTSKTFEFVASEISAEEAEEVGVEHLLRDIKDLGDSGGTLASRIGNQLASVKGLNSHLSDIFAYVDLVVEKKIPINHQISYLLQEIFNLLPNLDSEDFNHVLTVKTSDQMLVIYLASLIRGTIVLHNLINNKVHNREVELEGEERAKVKEEKKKDKDLRAKKTGDETVVAE